MPNTTTSVVVVTTRVVAIATVVVIVIHVVVVWTRTIKRLVDQMVQWVTLRIQEHSTEQPTLKVELDE
ncbi:hypothetical protein Tco_0440465, partial [Tanacetum coccineum]